MKKSLFLAGIMCCVLVPAYMSGDHVHTEKCGHTLKNKNKVKNKQFLISFLAKTIINKRRGVKSTLTSEEKKKIAPLVKRGFFANLGQQLGEQADKFVEVVEQEIEKVLDETEAAVDKIDAEINVTINEIEDAFQEIQDELTGLGEGVCESLDSLGEGLNGDGEGVSLHVDVDLELKGGNLKDKMKKGKTDEKLSDHV